MRELTEKDKENYARYADEQRRRRAQRERLIPVLLEDFKGGKYGTYGILTIDANGWWWQEDLAKVDVTDLVEYLILEMSKLEDATASQKGT
jgi:hypothetical protein